MCDKDKRGFWRGYDANGEIFHDDYFHERNVDFSIEPSKDKDFDIYLMTGHRENESDGDKK